MCVCVCLSVCLRAKGKTILFRRRGGWEIEWQYIHKDMMCVCVPQGDRMAIHSQRHGVCVCVAKRKTILFQRGGAGSGSSLARTHSWKTTKPQGCRRKQSTKPRRWGTGCRRSRGTEGYPVPQGGGGGEHTMMSNYFLKHKST